MQSAGREHFGGRLRAAPAEVLVWSRQLDRLREKLGDAPDQWLETFMTGPERSAA